MACEGFDRNPNRGAAIFALGIRERARVVVHKEARGRRNRLVELISDQGHRRGERVGAAALDAVLLIDFAAKLRKVGSPRKPLELRDKAPIARIGLVTIAAGMKLQRRHEPLHSV